VIEYIEGVLALKLPTLAVIDINGLGYRVLIPTSTYDRLPTEGSKARLLCHQHVREDALILFGFATKEERSLFDLLIGVS